MESDFNVAKLRERIAKLPADNVRLYFTGVKEVIDEINQERERLQEQVCFARETLPPQLVQLRELRSQLLHLKDKVLEACSAYHSTQDSLWNQLKKDVPDICDKLEQVSRQQGELSYLQKVHLLNVAEANIRESLLSSDYDSLFKHLYQLEEETFSSLNSEHMDDLKDRCGALIEKTGTLVHEAVVEKLSNLRYPFEEAIDMKSQESQIKDLGLLLKCSNLMQEDKLVNKLERFNVSEILFEPMKKRFNYHFCTEQKTNNISKPEWFLTQVLTWLSANAEFIAAVLRYTFDGMEIQNKTFRLFVKALLEITRKKVRRCAEACFSDAVLFSHLIDECVAFENELCDIDVPFSTGSIMAIVCEDSFFPSWLQLERESCIAAVENLLNSEDCWKNRYRSLSDIDPHRVPECTDKFLLIIESITERYRWIEDVQKQTKFLSLQIQMLDDFRLRLVQISQQVSSPWEGPFVEILNSVWYINSILNEWNEVEVFIRIQSANKKALSRGVFDDVAEMYKHVWHQRARDMANAFCQHIKARLVQYERENWFVLNRDDPSELTPSFCPFLLETRRLLGHVCKFISTDAAITIFTMLNDVIADVLYALITSIRPNAYGAKQITYDIVVNLIPVLNSLYESQPTTVTFEALDNSKFVELLACLKLLSLPAATAVLLYDEINRSPEEMTPSLLEPYDAAVVEKKRVLSLFINRCDLQLNLEDMIRF